MKNKYLITLNASQTVNGENEEMTFTAPAEYSIGEDGVKIIQYKEYTEEAITKDDFLLTTVKVVSDEKVSVTRQSKYTSKLFLEKHKIHQSQYKTPMGSVVFSVMCTAINDKLGETGGKLEVVYNLLHGAQLISENRFIITVKEN
ncbi:MAG: DUF1934 domain-containing protein [Ruminococcus sp.]|nr:DUF1934 domain-containing protein [Ruminococcus sp.]